MNKTYRPITSPPPVVYSPRAEQELLSRRKQIKSNYSKQPPCYALPMEVQKDNRVLHLLKSHVTSSNNLLKRSMHTENPLLVCMYPTEPNAPQIPILRNITITNQHMKSPQVHHNVSENEMLPCSFSGLVRKSACSSEGTCTIWNSPLATRIRHRRPRRKPYTRHQRA